MKTVNRIQVSGIAGRDAEAFGTAQKFSLAVKDSRKNKDGSWTEETVWFDVIGTGMPDVRKGDRVYVEGKFAVREHEGKTYPRIVFPTVLVLEKEQKPFVAEAEDDYPDTF